MSKTLEKLKQDSRVQDAYSEGEDGYWIHLKRGFINIADGVHMVHEWKIANVLDKMKSVRPCTCDDCTRVYHK